MSELDYFAIPAKITTLDQEALFLISYIKQETCPLPNAYMVVSYKVIYITRSQQIAGSTSHKNYYWMKGRRRNNVFSMLIPKEMYTVEQLDTLCRTHFIQHLQGIGRTVDYSDNFSDVFSQWIRGKAIVVFPNEEVTIHPRLRTIRIAQSFILDLENGIFQDEDSYVRYKFEIPRGLDARTFQYPFTISDDYLDLALAQITAPNTVRTTKPFFVKLNPNERITP